MAAILILSGLGIYVIFWSDHDLLPNPDGAGEWRSVPRSLRRFLRRGGGPVVISAALVQLASGVMFVVGTLRLLGIAAYPWSAVAYELMAGIWFIALASLWLVELRARRWARRRANESPERRRDTRAP